METKNIVLESYIITAYFLFLKLLKIWSLISIIMIYLQTSLTLKTYANLLQKSNTKKFFF